MTISIKASGVNVFVQYLRKSIAENEKVYFRKTLKIVACLTFIIGLTLLFRPS